MNSASVRSGEKNTALRGHLAPDQTNSRRCRACAFCQKSKAPHCNGRRREMLQARATDGRTGVWSHKIRHRLPALPAARNRESDAGMGLGVSGLKPEAPAPHGRGHADGVYPAGGALAPTKITGKSCKRSFSDPPHPSPLNDAIHIGRTCPLIANRSRI